jgi:hypothetical protein
VFSKKGVVVNNMKKTIAFWMRSFKHGDDGEKSKALLECN